MAEEQFLAAAVDAAKSTGEVDLVTETDKACEDLIFNHLRKLYPHHKFISEETSAVLGSTADFTDYPTWIVDPLDGTTNFVHGFPFVCVLIGLTIGKIPTVGLVYNPIMNESEWTALTVPLLTKSKSRREEDLSLASHLCAVLTPLQVPSLLPVPHHSNTSTKVVAIIEVLEMMVSAKAGAMMVRRRGVAITDTKMIWW